MKEENEKKGKSKGFFGKINMWRKKVWYRHKVKIIIFLLIFAFLVAYFWRNIFIPIYPGEAGVLWQRFFGGTVTTKVYGEGLHIIWPWDKMYVYTLRVRQKSNSVKILTRAGLYVEMDISYRFHPERNAQLPLLHKEWGPDYATKFVEPETKMAAIAVLGGYPPKKLYSLDTIEIQREIKKKLDGEFNGSHIVLNDFLITRLALPKTISDAIERKLTQEQLLQEYAFRLEVETKEKERKQVEALGIQLFEQIAGIPILKWRGLEVTSEIARSNNAKVIVIGTGNGGLPVILNADK
jgi:regulator of protease activity HflC (stomatin/prohibitin superfamily)